MNLPMKIPSVNEKNSEIFGWRERVKAADFVPLKPWKPRPLANSEWPPNYAAVYAWRVEEYARLCSDPVRLAQAKAYYKLHPMEFICHWVDTYNPRKASGKWTPFVFFEKQAEFLRFLEDCEKNNESGLVEKCRDAGVTWLACAKSVHCYLFNQDDAIGWGSRKQDLVDDIGNPDSIFEKMRLIIKRLPKFFLPEGFNYKKHMTFETMINPENGSVISGEAGDGIGRGGRKRIYFKDESAHYERPELIEASLGDNTNIQIDISSVNGLGNPFHRRREAGVVWRDGAKIEPGYTRVFIFDWRDHPEKTQEWYDTRRAKYEREGMLHLFAQEVDRNYSAAVQNTVIPYEWLLSCVDAHLKLGLTDAQLGDVWGAGLDVADGGVDRNAVAVRQSIVLRDCEEWGERDPGITTRRTIAKVRAHRGIKVQYDSIGVGSSVKSEYNRLVDDKIIAPNEIELVPWNAGAGVVDPFYNVIPDDPESILNKDMYANLKAQAWWSLRTRAYKTHQAVTNKTRYKVDDLFSIDSRMPLLHQVLKELAQPTHKPGGSMRTVINKQPEGTKSPNCGDATVMAYFPLENYTGGLQGSYGV